MSDLLPQTIKVEILHALIGKNSLQLTFEYNKEYSPSDPVYGIYLNDKNLGLRETKFSRAIRRYKEVKKVLKECKT